MVAKRRSSEPELLAPPIIMCTPTALPYNVRPIMCCRKSPIMRRFASPWRFASPLVGLLTTFGIFLREPSVQVLERLWTDHAYGSADQDERGRGRFAPHLGLW